MVTKATIKSTNINFCQNLNEFHFIASRNHQKGEKCQLNFLLGRIITTLKSENEIKQ